VHHNYWCGEPVAGFHFPKILWSARGLNAENRRFFPF
jgi:hypothetical protein